MIKLPTHLPSTEQFDSLDLPETKPNKEYKQADTICKNNKILRNRIAKKSKKTRCVNTARKTTRRKLNRRSSKKLNTSVTHTPHPLTHLLKAAKRLLKAVKKDFTLTEVHSEVLSTFASQLLVIILICALRRYFSSERVKNYSIQSLFFGMQKSAKLITVQISFLTLLQLAQLANKNKPNISKNSTEGLFLQTKGVFRVIDCINKCVMAPFIEEYIFRAGIYENLKVYVNPTLSAICTSALFSAAHLNLAGFLPIFLSSLLYTRSYELSGNINISIIHHIIDNSFVMLSLLCNEKKPKSKK